MRCAAILLGGLVLLTASPAAGAEAIFDLGTARLAFDDRGVVALAFADGTSWPASGVPAFALRSGGVTSLPRAVERREDRLVIEFDGGIAAQFDVTVQPGFAVFTLVSLSAPAAVEEVRLFQLPVPVGSAVRPTLNAATVGANVAAVMAVEPNVRASVEATATRTADRDGCRHRFEPTAEARAGRFAARFTATSDPRPGGWSMRGRSFATPLDLTGCTAIRAWVHGDGQGQALKIQLTDDAGGYRDDYLPIDFQGWRQVTLRDSPLNTLRYDRVVGLNVLYNSLPPDRTVTCLVDQIEAIVRREGEEQAIPVEDFETPDSPFWQDVPANLTATAFARHGLQPAAFGLIAGPEAQLFEILPRFEQAAGLPSPRPGGEWNKRSPWVRQSYLFLTRFGEAQFDEALALARRGGFRMILLGQESWCAATGHYAINRERFPDGLEGLKRTVRRFHDAGIRVGLHFLGPSVDPPDPYLTPVPDPRLAKGATAKLAADVDASADFLPLTAPPEGFPAEDGGYTGAGTVLQVGDELIQYDAPSRAEPFGFRDCRRGHLGTRAAAHARGTPVRHLLRSYGYHMFDMDTTLLDEVSAHFAAVANACDIDMIYFDGSERLQGDHWYYNAKLHKAFFDKLRRKDLLLQASSFSHFSWHLLARSASADGHGDLKGYLDERSPGFAALAREGMPLDIGWYYGYDPETTLDQFEYVLGATLGYDASMSYQVSVEAAARHPFSGAILDRITRYERLRLSDGVPPELKARLRIDPALGGTMAPERREALRTRRREYRLMGDDGQEVLRRVVYEPWHESRPDQPGRASWMVELPEPGRVGLQVHVRTGPWYVAGLYYGADDAVVLEAFDDLAPYTADQTDSDVKAIGPGQAGSVLPGVTQRVELRPGGKEGNLHAVYTAESRLDRPEGWSVFGRTFASPLDLSTCAGLGFWLRGDGRGGSFKLQLLDGENALDFYVPNDSSDWRYHQLSWPEDNPIQLRQVRSLMFYYNGLPGRTTVACGIDDVKALRRLDRQVVRDPWVEIAGRRLEWKGDLEEGQYLVLWPGEPPARFGPDPAPVGPDAPITPTIELPAGRHEVRLGQAGPASAALRARITLTTPEHHAVP